VCAQNSNSLGNAISDSGSPVSSSSTPDGKFYVARIVAPSRRAVTPGTHGHGEPGHDVSCRPDIRSAYTDRAPSQEFSQRLRENHLGERSAPALAREECNVGKGCMRSLRSPQTRGAEEPRPRPMPVVVMERPNAEGDLRPWLQCRAAGSAILCTAPAKGPERLRPQARPRALGARPGDAERSSATASARARRTISRNWPDILYLGFEWTWPRASGTAAPLLRRAWELSADDRLKRELIEYNMEDCRAAAKVKDTLLLICGGGSERDAVDIGSLEVDFQRNYGKFDSALPEFTKINDAAYWDYQRSKVYARTNRVIRRVVQQSQGRRKNNRRSASDGWRGPGKLSQA
jgi:RNase_H superfamily